MASRSEPAGGEVIERLLLRAALLDDERALAAWSELRDRLGSKPLPASATAMFGALRENLGPRGAGGLDEIERTQQSVWAHNSALLASVAPHLEQLHRAGIQTMLLKGAGLVAAGHQKLGFRYMADVDVLVPTARREQAARALVAGGMRPLDSGSIDYLLSAWPRYHTGFTLAAPDGHQLDLHWHLLRLSRQDDADDELWARAREVELRGVPTHVPGAADALLHAIVHGVAARGAADFRWVLDASVIIRGAAGDLDYGHFAAQARARRVTTVVAWGLAHMREVAEIVVPDDVAGALRSDAFGRVELRAWRTAPSAWTRRERVAFYYGQCARRDLPLGRRIGLLAQLRVAARGFGVRAPRDLASLTAGGTPGPGRPIAREAAAVDGLHTAAGGLEVAVGETLELGRGVPIERLFRYGAWDAQAGGVWLAGRRAELALTTATPTTGSLLLRLRLDHELAPQLGDSAIGVWAGASKLDIVAVRSGDSALSDLRFHIPARLAAGSSPLVLELRSKKSISPARLHISDDDRDLALFLRSLTLLKPPRVAPGSTLRFGVGGDGDCALAGGWSAAEAGGRWSDGPRARIVVALEQPPRNGELPIELVAEPYLGSPARTRSVELRAGGRRIERLAYSTSDPGVRTIAIPTSAIDGNGELVLELRMRPIAAPARQRIGRDERALGLFLRELRF